jgi:hypothetical protein
VRCSAKIRHFHSLDTDRVREGHTGLISRVQKSRAFIGYIHVKCGNVCNQKEFGKSKKSLSELSDPESLDGSPIDSKTRKQAIKARETRLTRKQSVPQYGRQFFIG